MTALRKVLFLDIDGVLTSLRSYEQLGGWPIGLSPGSINKFDSEAIGIVKDVCASTGASIVLSSTWRRLFSVSEMGAALGLPIASATPFLGDSRALRGEEIRAWLSAHPEVVSYAILDDDTDMLPEQVPHFVPVSFKTGLRPHHRGPLMNILAGP